MQADQVQIIGVVGAGTMGGGIAQIAAQSGYEVLLHDANPAMPTLAIDQIAGHYQRAVEKGRMLDTERAVALARIRSVGRLSDLAPAQMVIEAAAEDLVIKRSIFEALAAASTPDAILASNTSTLSISEIALSTPGPERVVGMHFFNPPALMALVEVIAGQQTNPTAIEATTAIARRMGKEPVLAADVPGFIVNRVARPFYLEGLRLLELNMASPALIDRAMREAAGFRMGPFELMDLIGLDINYMASKSVYEASGREPRFEPSPLQGQRVAEGRLGRKSRRGWYEYDAGGALIAPAISAQDEARVEEEKALLTEMATFSVDAARRSICLRVLAALINNAAWALSEGVASADDIDTAMRLGVNYPQGPLAWGDALGLARLVELLRALEAAEGPRYRPCPLLVDRAESQRRLYG